MRIRSSKDRIRFQRPADRPKQKRAQEGTAETSGRDFTIPDSSRASAPFEILYAVMTVLY